MAKDASHALPQRILLAVDGEGHTEKAIQWTINLCRLAGAQVTALHVRDPYLKQFYNEIYAQGRQAYLDHVDHELEREGRRTLQAFSDQARAAGIRYHLKERHGDPLEEISREMEEGNYDLLVVGGKPITGITAIRSWNLPAKLARSLGHISLLIVREEG